MKYRKNSITQPSDEARQEAKRESSRRYYAKNKSAVCAKRRARYDPAQARERRNNRREHLARHYKLTPVAWDEMFYRQGFCCDICGVHDLDYDGRWHTDHNHTTGKIRGILCHTCNTMLGMARDNSHTLVKAIDYLEKHNG